MITRRAFVSVVVMPAASRAAPAVWTQGRVEKNRIAVGDKAAFYSLPLTLAEQLGYFRSEGLEVEIVDFADSARASQALLGGSVQVCCGPYEDVITLQARRQFFRSFVLLGRAPQVAVGVSTRNLPDFHGIAELRGKRIGVSAHGASSHMVASRVLARGGLGVGDVAYVDVGSAASAVAALRGGQIDAISNTDPVMTLLEQKGDVRIIGDTRTLRGAREVFGGAMPAACLYASADFVRRNPALCQALANAMVHGLKWLQTAGSADVLKTVPEAYLLGDRALYLAAFIRMREAISPDGLMPADGPRTALEALAGFGADVKAAAIDLDRTSTNDFAQRAKQRFDA